MKTQITFVIVLLFAFTALNGQTTVTSTAGGNLEPAVRAAIGAAELSTVTNLIVTGTMDATDFRFIRDSLRELQSLDLGGVSIAAYSGTGGTVFNTTNGADVSFNYGADTVPRYALYKRYTSGFIPPVTVHETALTKLTSVILPGSAKVISAFAIGGTHASTIDLSNMAVLGSIRDYAFCFSPLLKEIVYPLSLTHLGSKVIQSCPVFDTFIIPGTVATLGTASDFFDGCKALKAVIFEEPSKVASLPNNMFGASNNNDATLTLDSLFYVKVPSSVTDIGTAFDKFNGTHIDCEPTNGTYESIGGLLYLRSDGSLVAVPKGLTSITLPAAVTEIADYLFEGSQLTSITVLGNLTRIGYRAFYGSSITSFDFQPSLVEIGDYAFTETKLTTVSLTNNPNLETFGSGIFSEIKTLQSVDVSGLSVLGNAMFRGCDALTTIVFGSSSAITKIPASTFAMCSALTSAVLPNTVDSIMQSVFADCRQLTNITLPTSLKYLGGMAFSRTAIPSLTVPASCTEIETYLYGGTAFSGTCINVNVEEGNPNYASQNGMLFNKQGTKLYYIPNSTTKESVIVPEGVDTIMPYTFYPVQDDNMIVKLTLPTTLKFIASYGLYGASYIDTIVVNAVVPPYCASGTALNNNFNYSTKRVIIPPRTKHLYKTATVWKNYHDTIFLMEGKFLDMGYGITAAISPNGQYVVGNEYNQAYIFDMLTNVQTPMYGASEARDVNDSAHVAVVFADDEYIVDGTPILNGGVYRNDTIYSVGLGRYGAATNTIEAKSNLMTIDAAGNVYGTSYQKNSLASVVPFVWKFNGVDYTTDTMAFDYPNSDGDQGAKILSISSDGQVASGWLARNINGGDRHPIAWTSPTTYKLFNKETGGEASAVSPNGRYIALQHERCAAIYDIATDKLTDFGSYNSMPTAVSDNGFVVGYAATDGDRRAFIWSDKLGFMYFSDFIPKYLPTMQMPEDDHLRFPPNGGIFEVPMDISADGLTICGWNGYSAVSRKGWIMIIPDTLDLIDRPHDVSAIVDIPQRNVVNLSWTAPVDYGTHTLDFYYIYRNGEYIGRVEPYEGSNYTDNDVPAGLVYYQISAVFDYKDATYLESTKTDIVKVIIVDDYNLPFMEDFESTYFETNFWTAETSPTSAWLAHFAYTGFNGMRSAVFLGSGNQTAYNLSLTSKPLDAASKNNILLTFVYRLNANTTEFLGLKDTVFVEIGVNDVWTSVKQIIVNNVFGWTPITLDISEIAAGNLFRVRFRASSGANRNMYNFFIDDIGVATETSAAPSGVIAYRISNDPVRVLYKDITGSYVLSYTNGVIDWGIGNEGNPIITVNRYTPHELCKLKDKYLTSISAFLFPDHLGTVIPSQLKLAVFVNGVRVESSNITSWKGNAWNTFPLSKPIKITGKETLLVGIEAASGDEYNLPLSIDARDTMVNKNGNLYSEDDGKTWLHADKAGIIGHWGITANIRDEAAAATPDHDFFNVRYEIYRNNTKIKALNYGQLYLDSTATADDDCYSVMVFRPLGGMSEMSSTGCIEVVEMTKIEDIEDADPVYVYPNPTSTVVNIVADNYKLVRVLNMQGQEVQRQSAGSQVDLYKQPNGMYLLEITTRDNRTRTVKVIKK